MMSSRPAILAIVASFLAVVLVYNNSSVVVFAAPREGPGLDKEDCTYTGTDIVKSTCCWTEKERGPYPKIGTTEVKYCQTCYLDNDSGTTYCKPKEKQSATPSSNPLAEPLQPGNVFEQQPPPLSQLPNVKDNTKIQNDGGVLQQQPDQGTTQTDETPHIKNKAKRSEDGSSSVLEQPQNGELTAEKRGNKDNSPTPPACPTDNSPIPPDCTLKPKF